EKCTFRYIGVTDCNADSQCMYSQSTSQCTPICALKTTSMCRTHPNCELRPNGTCDLKCMYKYTTEPSCTSDWLCRWDVFHQNCDKMCSAVTSEISCAANAMCEWSLDGCINRCEYRYGNVSACNLDVECTWNNFTGQCTKDCPLIFDADKCNSGSSCEWLNDKCVNSCLVDFSDNLDECVNATPRCQVNQVDGTCMKACNRMSTSIECNANDDICEWSPTRGVCATQCKFAGITPQGCRNITGCYWDAGVAECKKDCNGIQDPNECNAAVDCVMYNSLCTRRCSAMNETECFNNDRCFWNYDSTVNANVGCQDKCSIKYTTEASCEGNDLCMWDVTKLECRRACDALSSMQYPQLAWSEVRDFCLNDPMCEVPPSNNRTCTMRCEFKYDTESSCSNDDGCVWDQTRSRCATHCVLLNGRTLCSS
ncbi:MAG: hypothetical protein Q8J97_04710, partial [Flavobacteriaceae bacterium]|nr:hypothetical protein [Flavobacteriaceae bacterium]